ESGENYLIKLKRNSILSRLGDLSLPGSENEDMTILPHSSYSDTVYQANSWVHARRVCQFSERKDGELFYEVTSLVTNLAGGASEECFQLYRKRGQSENFIKEMKSGFFGDKTDSSTLIKNEVRMMISCLAYNLSLFMKHLASGSVKNLTMKRFRKLFVKIAGKCVKSARKQILKLSNLYSLKDEFQALFERISRLDFSLPVLYAVRETSPPLLGN
ncbi:transposase, partial [Streptococcus sp. NLN76]|uniref:transposase n=1 Tax=Streptococcus sp. NLN76 TaxID=2822800 RepID=UPI0018AB9724